MTPFEHTIRTLQKTLKHTLLPSVQAETLAELAWQFRHVRPKSSLIHTRRALALCRGTRTAAEANALLAGGLHALRHADSEQTGIEQILEAKSIAVASDNERVLARAMMMEGAYYSKYGDYRNGRELFLRALEIFERLAAADDISSVRYNLGYQYGLLKEYSTAMFYMMEARAGYQQHGLYEQALRCSVSIVGYYMQTGDTEAAAHLCNMGMAEAEELGIILLQSRFCNLHALILMHTGDSNTAYQQFGRAAALGIEGGDKGTYFMSLINQTQILLQWGDYPKAMTILTTVIGMAGKYNWDMRIHAMNNIGKIFMALNDTPRALEFFLEVYSAVEKLGTNHLGGIFLTTLVNLGMAFSHLGEYDKAESYLKQAALRASTAGDAIITITGYLGLAEVYLKCQSFDEARSAAEQGYSVAANIGDPWGKITAQILVAQAEENTGNTAEAAEMFRNAVKAAEDARFMPLTATALQSLAHVEEVLGNMSAAFAALKRYYDIERSLTGSAVQSAASRMVIEFSTRDLRNEHSELRSKAEFLELEIQRKERELQTIASQLAQKNEAMKAMRDELKAITERRGRKSEKARRLLETSVDTHDPNGAWKQFDEQFSRVHGAFIDSLNRRHTELSTTEQKICCLLKIRLSSKEIANLLYLSLRTVETHRLNIRRKLHIDRTFDISNYLNTLVAERTTG